MNDIEKLKHIIDRIEDALDDMGHEGRLLMTAGMYGDEGHVGDDDRDVVGMLWIEEQLSDTESRTWNVRVKLDD